MFVPRNSFDHAAEPQCKLHMCLCVLTVIKMITHICLGSSDSMPCDDDVASVPPLLQSALPTCVKGGEPSSCMCCQLLLDPIKHLPPMTSSQLPAALQVGTRECQEASRTDVSLPVGSTGVLAEGRLWT
jgi:hypothetical protein